MSFINKNIRFFIFLFSGFLSTAVHLYIVGSIDTFELQNIRLVQVYAFISLLFLYLTLLISPLYLAFPSIPFRSTSIIARRALGVSSFYFASLHGFIAFFNLLGGFEGFGFLGAKYKVAVLLGSMNLIILGLLAATSFDFAIKKLGKKWKLIHRLVYLAGVLILIHAFMLGSNFTDPSDVLTIIPSYAFILLIFLEGIRVNKFISKKYQKNTILRIITAGITIMISSAIFYFLILGNINSLNLSVYK